MNEFFKKIVIPIDLADKHSIRAVLPMALQLTQKCNSELFIIYIIPDFGMKVIEDYLPKHWVKDQKNKHEHQIKEIVKQHIPDEITVNIKVGRGAVYDEVIQYANDIKADLIMVSAVRPQLRDYMLGPNASKIVRHAGISVLVVRE